VVVMTPAAETLVPLKVRALAEGRSLPTSSAR
jgi:hypothetical protein